MRRIPAGLLMLALAAPIAAAQIPTPQPAVLFQRYVNVTTTGTTAETNQVPVLIPGGVMSANGAMMIICNYTYSASNPNKTFTIRLASSPGVVGTPIINSLQSGTQNQAGELLLLVRAANSTNNTQVIQPRDALGMGLPLAPITTTQDMSKDAYLNFDVQLASATDKATLIGYSILVLNPGG